MMYFKGNMLYFNNLTISIFGLVFLIYAFIETRKFLDFYNKKFYLTFALHFYALLLNGAHALIIQHNIVNATLVTETCILLLMSCFFGLTVIWTYNYYLKFIYSFITEKHFKTLTKLFLPIAFWKHQHRDYYDYDTLELTSDTEEEANDDEYQSGDENNEIFQNGWFRYMNYQILGNYLFTQMFNLFAITFTFFVRTISISVDVPIMSQLTFLSIGMSCFVNVSLFFDFHYRRFTKSLIMPHLTILVLMGTWMFEHYKNSSIRRPEPVSVCTFIYLFIYIVIKFAFLTDTNSIQMREMRKKEI